MDQLGEGSVLHVVSKALQTFITTGRMTITIQQQILLNFVKVVTVKQLGKWANTIHMDIKIDPSP